ncbi:hypothetical protein OG216_20385 [Streptomycetaceae bacterium NBC_01309]
MPWWTEQILIGTAVWTAVTAVAAAALLRMRGKQYARDSATVDRVLARNISLYQATEFTRTNSTEVAVWLLLEAGYVDVARDGRIRATVASITRPRPPLDDPAQAAVLDFLRRHPSGSKLHEIMQDPTYSGVRELHPNLVVSFPELRTLARGGARNRAMAAAYLIPLGAAVGAIVHATATAADYRAEAIFYWTAATIAGLIALPVTASRLFPRSMQRGIRRRLDEHCERLLTTRFAGLGYEEERRSAGVYRSKAPAYSPSRSGSSSSSSTSVGVDCAGSSSCGSSCSSSSCGGGSSCS